VRSHGSVFPQSCFYALVPSLLAFALKYIDSQGIYKVSEWKLLQQSAAWTVFTGTVGFLLVFRTGHCYSRFVDSSKSVFAMKTQLREAYSNLVAFSKMSKAPKAELILFQDKLIHLFSTLHACALASVAGSSHNTFNIVDLDHVPSRFIHALQECKPEARVELAYQWTCQLVIREIPTGLLNVPPPILSRIFQAMEKAMLEYNNVVQLMTIPYPFPYSQACFLFMWLHLTVMPVVVVGWTGQPASAGLLTFLSAACFMSLELISAELENPFGDDVNDLPVTWIHNQFNDSLQLLLHPSLDERFVLKKHRQSDLLKEETHHQLDGYVAGDHENDFAFRTSMGFEIGDAPDVDYLDWKGLQSAQQPVPKAPQQAVPKAPAAGEQQTAPKSAPNAPDQPSSASPPGTSALLDLPWLSDFAQRQRKFEDDILRRMDQIVRALTEPSWVCHKQTILCGPGGGDDQSWNLDRGNYSPRSAGCA